MPTTEKEEVSEMAEDIKDRADSNGHSDDRSSVRDALTSKELLVPAALSAVGRWLPRRGRTSCAR